MKPIFKLIKHGSNKKLMNYCQMQNGINIRNDEGITPLIYAVFVQSRMRHSGFIPDSSSFTD